MNSSIERPADSRPELKDDLRRSIEERVENIRTRSQYRQATEQGIARALGWFDLQFDEANREWTGVHPGRGIRMSIPSFTADPEALQNGLWDLLALFGAVERHQTEEAAARFYTLLSFVNYELTHPRKPEEWIT